VHEPHLSRDHTERMLAARGVTVERKGTSVSVPPAQTIKPANARVPADPSSAAFFVALAVLGQSSELLLPDVCLNPTRTGFLSVLRRMGAAIEIRDEREEGGDSIGTVVARSSSLHGVEIAPEDIPSLIDELPLFACVAARASGESVVTGAAELRVKESDRIATIVANLAAVGATAEELSDGFRVTGSDGPLQGQVRTDADHRIAMAFGVLGAASRDQISVDDPDCVGVSFPSFWKELSRVRQ